MGGDLKTEDRLDTVAKHLFQHLLNLGMGDDVVYVSSSAEDGIVVVVRSDETISSCPNEFMDTPVKVEVRKTIRKSNISLDTPD